MILRTKSFECICSCLHFILVFLKWAWSFAESLPSEWVAAELVKLGTLKLSNNLISEKEPFFVPKFVLELPKYVMWQMPMLVQ